MRPHERDAKELTETERRERLKKRIRERDREREKMIRRGCVCVEGLFWRENNENMWLEGRFYVSTQPHKPRVCIYVYFVCLFVCVLCDV